MDDLAANGRNRSKWISRWSPHSADQAVCSVVTELNVLFKGTGGHAASQWSERVRNRDMVRPTIKTTSVKSCMLDSIVDEKYERSLRSFLVLYLCIIITLFNTYGSSEYSDILLCSDLEHLLKRWAAPSVRTARQLP